MIQINDKVRIVRVDKLNLELQEYRKIVDIKTKEERYDWCWVGFYGDFKSAINGVLKHFTMEMTEQEINGCEEVLKYLEKFDSELKSAVKDLKVKDKKGKWIYSSMGCVITCSNCGERLELCYPDGTEIRQTPYCLNCGAKMEIEE